MYEFLKHQLKLYNSKVNVVVEILCIWHSIILFNIENKFYTRKNSICTKENFIIPITPLIYYNSIPFSYCYVSNSTNNKLTILIKQERKKYK